MLPLRSRRLPVLLLPLLRLLRSHRLPVLLLLPLRLPRSLQLRKVLRKVLLMTYRFRGL